MRLSNYSNLQFAQGAHFELIFRNIADANAARVLSEWEYPEQDLTIPNLQLHDIKLSLKS
jgi:hypothetical protein